MYARQPESASLNTLVQWLRRSAEAVDIQSRYSVPHAERVPVHLTVFQDTSFGVTGGRIQRLQEPP